MSEVTRNRPSREGRDLGEQLARLTDAAETEGRKTFPDHMPRCNSCAFTRGTFPNGCLPTVMDALKCAVEGKPFYCHQNLDENGDPIDLCSGWLFVQGELKFLEVTLPYDFSEVVKDKS